MKRIWRMGAGVLLAGWAGMAAAQDWTRPNGDGEATRFSRAGQITPGNIARLRELWVFHMKPAAAAVAAPNAADRAQAAAEQAGPPPGAPRFPGFFGNGRFSASETAPLVIGARMYVGTPYGQVVALDAASGKAIWTHDLPKGVQPARRGWIIGQVKKAQARRCSSGAATGGSMRCVWPMDSRWRGLAKTVRSI
jgi:quinoprotein glucose dehydrogenase